MKKKTNFPHLNFQFTILEKKKKFYVKKEVNEAKKKKKKERKTFLNLLLSRTAEGLNFFDWENVLKCVTEYN